MSYDMIDRFLRNNLGDDDYAEYSAALDSLCAPQRTWVGLTDTEKYPLADDVARRGVPVFEAICEAEAKLRKKNK